MNDTTPGAEQKLRELYARRTGEERLRMGCDLFDAAKQLATAGLLGEGTAALRERLFRRLYGGDFGVEEEDRILRRLREHDARTRGAP